MVDFDDIMGMDQLSSSYATVYCLTNIVHFQFTKEALLECKGNIMMPKGKFISYLKENKIMYK